jgi:hypothetical protein
MAKTYNTIGNFTAGQVLTAAEMNELGENSNNYRVPPYCQIQRAAGQTIPDASNTAISFDAQDHDTDGMFAPTSTDVTIQTAGIYLVEAETRLSSPCDIRGDLLLKVGGTIYRREIAYGSAEYFHVTMVMALTAAQVITLEQYQDNSANSTRTLTARMSVAWIGQAS